MKEGTWKEEWKKVHERENEWRHREGRIKEITRKEVGKKAQKRNESTRAGEWKKIKEKKDESK